MPHPFLDLLANRKIRYLWIGEAFSALGTQLGSIALIWLAIEAAGSDAAILTTVSNAVLLVVSLLSGAFVDRFRPRTVMIASDIVAAVFAVVPVVVAFWLPVSLPTLVLSIVGLAASGALFQPALQSSVPTLAGNPGRVQGLNGLLDSTYRLSRLAGPFVAGLLNLFLPTIQLLTANALSFLASAGAVAQLNMSTEAPQSRHETVSTWNSLLLGVDATAQHRDVRRILLANTMILMAWAPGLTLGFPLLVAESGLTGLGLSGLGVVAALMGAYGAGDFLSNVVVVTHTPRRTGVFMFTGYIVLGSALAAVPLLMWTVPGNARLPAMMVAALVAGAGGPMFFLPMMTYIQTHIDPSKLGGVLRLRFAMISAAMMVGSAIAPPLFDRLSAPAVILLCGACIAFVGLFGTILCRDLRQTPDVSH
jgi:MFS transporter, DHA3 family, macrolide efflux protein